MNSNANEQTTKSPNDNSDQFFTSVHSLSDFKDKSFKTFIPQIIAAFIAISFHIVIGIAFAYSAILIPQLQESQNRTININDSEIVINVTEKDIAWIASVLPTVVLPASVIGGILIDSIGRLNTLKLATIPSAIGWVLIATAQNVPMLIIGRMLTGTSIALGASPAMVYTSEISAPNIRGSLISIAPCFVSFGMMLAYLEGWLLNWRIVAWTCLAYAIVPIAFVILCLPESPTWLVSKNRTDRARQSLKWFNRYREQQQGHTKTYTEVQLRVLERDQLLKGKQADPTENQPKSKFQMLLEPTFYKPLLILTFLYFFQQFSGLFIILFYTVSFFEAVGTKFSPYFAAVLVGAVRFLMSIVAIALMKRFSRRALIMVSGFGMAVSIGVSGLFTDLIKEGKTTQTWVPTALILIYIASSMVGYLGIPWTIIGELFPMEVRGVGQSISFGVANLMMFASIQLYFTMIRLFGGLAGLQYFFAAIALAGVFYCYVFLPETHNKKLSEIQDYFRNHTTYFSLKRHQKHLKESGQK